MSYIDFDIDFQSNVYYTVEENGPQLRTNNLIRSQIDSVICLGIKNRYTYLFVLKYYKLKNNSAVTMHASLCLTLLVCLYNA